MDSLGCLYNGPGVRKRTHPRPQDPVKVTSQKVCYNIRQTMRGSCRCLRPKIKSPQAGHAWTGHLTASAGFFIRPRSSPGSDSGPAHVSSAPGRYSRIPAGERDRSPGSAGSPSPADPPSSGSATGLRQKLRPSPNATCSRSAIAPAPIPESWPEESLQADSLCRKPLPASSLRSAKPSASVRS